MIWRSEGITCIFASYLGPTAISLLPYLGHVWRILSHHVGREGIARYHYRIYDIDLFALSPIDVRVSVLPYGRD